MTNLNKISAEDFFARKPRDSCSFIIPFIYKPIRIDSEYRSICCVDESLQLLSDSSFLHLDLLTFRNVLTYSNHADDSAVHISASRCIEQNFHTTPVLGVQRKFEVRGFSPLKRIIKDLFHTLLKLGCDEILQN